MKRLALGMVLTLGAVGHPLSEKVTIRRDTYGVPHILAQSEEAAAFGMGFAQAEDHCIEVARRLVAARGEQHSRLGSGLEADFFARRFIHPQAEAALPRLSPLLQSMMRAYAEGFNLYVDRHRQTLPKWIPRFDAVDVVAQGRAQIIRFAFPRAMIETIQRKYPGERAWLPPAEPELTGSNMWAIAPSKSKSGKALLLGNPHQAWSALYWEAQVTVPGRINFYGGTFVGSPVLTTGFNEHLGWTHTVNYPDLDDVLMMDANRTPLRRLEVSAGGQSRTYWETDAGPVVHRTAEKVFVLKSAALSAWAYAEEWYALSKARNWNEFRTILERNQLPMFNLAYADLAGNIFYLWNGMVPKRTDDGTDYRFEVPGDDRHTWRELHPTRELPQLFNPKGGYVQNCNAPPWWTSLQSLLDPTQYPSYFEAGRPLGLRTMMSLRMLEENRKLSLEDVQRLKFNNHMLLADRVVPHLVSLVRGLADRSNELQRAMLTLENWDHTTAASSRGSVLFERFWELYTKAVPQPYAQPWRAGAATTTPSGIADPDAAFDALEEAVRVTRKKWGREDIEWGHVHRIRLGDLDLPSDGGSGLLGIFHVIDYREAADGRSVVGSAGGESLSGGGDGWIFTIEFAKPVRAYSLLAYGQTSNPQSKHRTDQASLFAEHKFKPVRFTERDIRTHLERSYRPE